MKTKAGALLSSIRIDRDTDRKISIQLYMGLKEILLSGGVNPGERLPASRTLAKEIGVSRTTVIDALDRLMAEGLLEARVGAGTFVSAFVSWQPKSRSRLRLEDYLPAWDSLFEHVPATCTRALDSFSVSKPSCVTAALLASSASGGRAISRMPLSAEVLAASPSAAKNPGTS